MVPGSMDEPIQLSFELNGVPVEASARPKRSALDVLREDLGQSTLKPGCSPQGICGSCLALIDGKPRLTCTLPSKSLSGKQVCTLAGLPQEETAQLAGAFCDAGAVACGYCIPGILTQTSALLQRLPQPGDEDIQKALNMHTCRCTGWWRIEEAVRQAASARSEGRAASAPSEATLLALGEQAFLDDHQLPGMWHAALVWSPTARGVLREVDTSGALELAHKVLTFADLPVATEARPLLIGPGAELRGGDAVALVIAATRELAYAARARVKVQFDALPAVIGLAEAAADSERVVMVRRHSVGQLNRALDDRSLVFIKETFTSSARQAAFIEPEGAIGIPSAGGLRVLSNSDRPADQAAQTASALGLTPHTVRVEQLASGGSFGGRGASSCAAWAGLAARAVQAPVKLSLDLDECPRVALMTPAMSARMMLGARPDGTLLGLKALIQVDLGAWPVAGDALMDLLLEHATGAWNIPHVELELRGVRTDKPPSGPTRGALATWFFALEGCLDRLAEKLGRDALDLRLQAAEDPALLGVLRALEPAWRAAREAGQPVGVAAACHRVRGDGARVLLELQPGPELRLRVPGPEEGQGAWALLRALLAQRLDLPASWITVWNDSAVRGDADPALLGHAVLAAADALNQALGEGSLADLMGRSFEGESAPGHSATAYAAQLVRLDPKGKIAELIAAQDFGVLPLPEVAMGQLDGALGFGLGAAWSEDLWLNEGMPDPRLRNVGVLKAAQMPPRHPIALASPSADGAAGLRPWTEVSVLPTAPAFASAQALLDGRRRVQFPITDCAAAPRRSNPKPA